MTAATRALEAAKSLNILISAVLKRAKNTTKVERTSRYVGQSENIKVVKHLPLVPISGQSLSVYLPNNKGFLVRSG